MGGGEIFVPKIPSVRIVDLAKAMAPHIPTKIIGIRPGEKLHEVMCPSDDSHLTVEFDSYFVITPSITFYSRDQDFTKNAIQGKGHLVTQGFEYSSGSNNHFLDLDNIKLYNEKSGY
jgi:UDP-N-acetylglucosamine 4,6-dehydratase